MAPPGSSHSFTPIENFPSATFSVAAFEPENRHLRHFLLKTRELAGLSPEQLPVPSLEDVGDFTLAESTILPLLCSMTHAMATTLKAVEKLRLQTSDLEARVANSLPDIIDHSTQVNQIHASLHDLSHWVAHLPTAQVMAPPQANHPVHAPQQSTPLMPPQPEGLLHNPQKVRRHPLQRSWVAPANSTKKPGKTWPLKRPRERKSQLTTPLQRKSRKPSRMPTPPRPQPLSPVLQEDFSPLTRPLDLTLTPLT